MCLKRGSQVVDVPVSALFPVLCKDKPLERPGCGKTTVASVMSVIKAHGCRCVAAVVHIGFALLYRVLLVCFYITERSGSEFLPGSAFLFGGCVCV